jgi:hypothetical protein
VNIGQFTSNFTVVEGLSATIALIAIAISVLALIYSRRSTLSSERAAAAAEKAAEASRRQADAAERAHSVDSDRRQLELERNRKKLHDLTYPFYMNLKRIRGNLTELNRDEIFSGPLLHRDKLAEVRLAANEAQIHFAEPDFDEWSAETDGLFSLQPKLLLQNRQRDIARLTETLDALRPFLKWE